MSLPKPPVAKRTGRTYSNDYGTIYEVLCPSCLMNQVHDPGIARCIFCNARFQVVPFQIIRKVAPENPPEGKGE